MATMQVIYSLARANRTGYPFNVVSRGSTSSDGGVSAQRTCLRCGKLYESDANSATACAYHAHMTGEKGFFTLAPPHQGIDGKWTDKSGVIVYKWNAAENRPNSGRKNWKSRWTCCGLYEIDAPPCRLGWHASYDDGATLF
ncbi:hypothetical protein GOP47_0016867 [Adiantum capillus-veneris]|uniref:Uncharacterized protein n=1 Tax=Adiantum capillus-veneris TaxID=13818 RepID=A0A9D4UIV6_ADICA|nr:hypothetical protein GOP47_0016867 [Adiantum capillus-veneris]